MLELMDSEEVVALQAAVRDAARQTIVGATPSPDRSGLVPEPALRALSGMGLLSPRTVADDGQGIPGHLEWTVIAEELGTADAGTALSVVLSAYASIFVSRCGTQQQRRHAFAGDQSARGALLYFEGFGRSPLELETAATQGDPAAQGWSISGRKITAGGYAGSNFAVALARERGRLRALYVPTDRLAQLTAATSTQHETLGARSARLSVVDLVELSGAELMPGGSAAEVHRLVAGARLAVASILIGTAEVAIRYAAHYASTREAFGRPISGFQGVAFPLVDAEIAVDAARLAIQDLAAELDNADDPSALSAATGAAVAGAAQAGAAATATAVNTLGGHGYLTDHPVERWYRDAAVLATLDFDPLLTDWSGIH